MCLWRGGADGEVLYHHSNPIGGIVFPLLDEIDSCDYGWLEATPSPTQPTSTQTAYPAQALFTLLHLLAWTESLGGGRHRGVLEYFKDEEVCRWQRSLKYRTV